MKIEITVSKSELLSKLKAVAKVINPVSKVLPAYSNFLFEIFHEFQVTGADPSGNITADVKCSFSVTEENFSFLVDSKTMLDCLRELPEQPLAMIIEEQGKGFVLTILYEGGKYHLHTYPTEGFALLKNQSVLSKLVDLDCDLVIDSIKAVYPFAGNEEIRPVMTSVYVENRIGIITFCATNGSTMAVLEKDSPVPRDFDLTIPTKLAKIIIDLAPREEGAKINLEIGDKNVGVTFGDIRIVYRLPEGKYPNFRSVIPKSNDKYLRTGTSGILSSLKRAAIFADRTESPVVLEVKESLKLISRSSEMDQFVEDTIKADDNCSGFKIAFAISSLLRCIEAIQTDNTQMTFSEPKRACLITPYDDVNLGLTVLIMPLDINV
ncbi:MAG: DNA polymerase III subunit beta [Mangrovibacterium sp.]